MALGSGDIVDDVWVIEHPLGSGGMGSVYRAHHRRAERITAAIKILDEGVAHLTEAQRRFLREAEILYGIDHPHIVKVRNVRPDATPPYIEMEFVEGESLEARLRGGKLPLDHAVLYAEQLASALRYLHRNGIFHRDVKPANLLIRKRVLLNLVDFGLALQEGGERITRAGGAFGTVAYAPPEWIRPTGLEPRAWDMYALGVVLHEMLTGEFAFVAPLDVGPREAAIDVMVEKQGVEFLDPGDEVDEALRALVRDLTRTDPEARLVDAGVVIERLQAAQRGLGLDLMEVLASGLDGEDLRQAVAARAMEVSRPPSLLPGAQPRKSELERLKAVPSGAVAELDRRRAAAGLPPPSSSTPAPTPRRWGPVVVVGVGATAAAAVAGLVVLVVAGAMWWLASGPGTRPVTVLLTGVPRTTEATLLLDHRPPTSQDGLTLTFDDVPVGVHAVDWAIGSGCASTSCPGTDCAVWCTTGTQQLEVPDGSGEVQLPVEVVPPAERAVPITVVHARRDAPAVTLGGTSLAVRDGKVVFVAVTPGVYDVEARVGVCSDEAVGCAASGDCPTGCSSTVATVTVPLEGSPQPDTLEVPPARQGRSHTVPAPALITHSEYAAWLADHPEWTREAAIERGAADASYLRGFDPEERSGKPVTRVPWTAARDFCTDRHALLHLAAAPTSWNHYEVGVFQEWRDASGRAAWRRHDGAASTELSPVDFDAVTRRGLLPSETNAFTGFRCAR